jgi:hypothetical protein
VPAWGPAGEDRYIYKLTSPGYTDINHPSGSIKRGLAIPTPVSAKPWNGRCASFVSSPSRNTSGCVACFGVFFIPLGVFRHISHILRPEAMLGRAREHDEDSRASIPWLCADAEADWNSRSRQTGDAGVVRHVVCRYSVEAVWRQKCLFFWSQQIR